MSNKQTHILVFSPMAPTGCSKCNFSGSDLDRYPCPNQDQLNDLQPSDHTSDTARANAPQSTPTLKESIDNKLDFILKAYGVWIVDSRGGISFTEAKNELESLLSDRIREARLDELNKMPTRTMDDPDDDTNVFWYRTYTMPEFEARLAALQEKRKS